MSRAVSIGAVALTVVTSSVCAQTTDTERDRVLARVAALWSGELQSVSDWIGHHPEVGWHEFQAVDTLTALLRRYGFRVDTGVAGMPTAFVARWESPAG